jgi:hypothetical protein
LKNCRILFVCREHNFIFPTGWPEWANFCLCAIFTLVIIIKITQEANFWTTLFTKNNVKIRPGPILGAIFYKKIRSPCFPIWNAFRGEKIKSVTTVCTIINLNSFFTSFVRTPSDALEISTSTSNQGCQMVYFQTKNPNFGKFWRALDWEMLYIFYGNLECFTDNWDVLWSFGTFCDNLVQFSHFGITCQEKSGNPDIDDCSVCSYAHKISTDVRPAQVT